MITANLVLWLAGAVLIAVGYLQVRGPYARYRQLQEADENARRYDQWRGARRPESERDVTGADVMRAMLRRRLQLWALVAVAGFVLVFLGFAIR